VIIVNKASRGCTIIEQLLSAHVKGIAIDEMVNSKHVVAYPFSDTGGEAVARVHKKFERSSNRPYRYRLKN
jgi:hypothetical protein